MSKKTPPEADPFGEFDEWFDSKSEENFDREPVVEFVADPKVAAARAEEARKAVDARQKSEAAAAVAAEQAKRVEAQAKRAESQRQAEEARKAQLLRLAEEAKKADEARQIEARKADEARQIEAKKADEARQIEAKSAEEARALAAARDQAEADAAAQRKAEAVAEAVRTAESAAREERDRKAAEAVGARATSAAEQQADEAAAAVRVVEEVRRVTEVDASRASGASARRSLANAPTVLRKRGEEDVSSDATEDIDVIDEGPGAARRPLMVRIPVVSPRGASTQRRVDVAATDPDLPPVPGIPQEIASSAPTEPDPGLAPAVPDASEGEGSWDTAIRLLEQEATGPNREARLVAAAYFARVRVGQPARAARILESLGEDAGPRALRERVATFLALGDVPAAAASVRRLAAALAGPEAGEVWLHASELARSIGVLDAASMAQAGQLLPADPRPLRLEVDRSRQDGEARGTAESLVALAEVLPAAEGAEAFAEAAALFERAEEPDRALACWRRVRDTDPGQPGVLSGLERHLRRTGAFAELAAVFQAEGDRLSADPAMERAEASWWYGRAARVHATSLFDSAAAATCYRLAAEQSPANAGLRREVEAQLADAGRWDDVAASLRAEIVAAPEDARSFLQFRLGRVCEERLKDVDGALDAYRAAAADPAAAPAAEAVLRLLGERKDWPRLLEFLEERVAHLDDPSIIVTALYRAGETCEGPLNDQARAQSWYERVVEVSPGYLPALEALERVYNRLEEWARLAALYEQRALIAESPGGVALQRHRAGAVYEFRLDDPDRAAEQFRMALEAVPDFPPSLDAYARVLESVDDWAGLGSMLRRAAEVSREHNEAVSLYYRSARVLADRTTDVAGAIASLHRCLDRSPGFLPAVLLLKDLAARAGDWAEVNRIERMQAELGGDVNRRHFRLLASAEASIGSGDGEATALVERVLRDDPQLPAAVALSERIALQQGAVVRLLPGTLRMAEESVDPQVRAALGTRAAELAAEARDIEAFRQAVEVLLSGDTAGIPGRALARSALLLDQGDLVPRIVASAALAGTTESVRFGAPVSVARDAGAGLDRGDTTLAAAVIRQGGDEATLGRAHLALAQAAIGPVRADHAAAAGRAFSAAGLGSESIAAWRLAWEAHPSAYGTRDGLRAALVAAADTEGLRAWYASLPEEDRDGLGDALEVAGDAAGAIVAWREVMARAGDPLPWSLRIERAQASLGDWRGVFDTLNVRIPQLEGEARANATARCRWLLTERLADSDETWTFYQQLHASNPEDVEILESLARSAGARGDTKLAVDYLEDLARKATAPTDVARYHRRLAEAYEQSGDTDTARTAYGVALDVLPEDRESLQGLRRLAEGAKDWQGVVGVLARLAALSTGREQIERFVEIARLWDDKLGDRGVAADAWRKVLDLAPEDPEALRRLVALGEENRDWAGFVEYAQSLIPLTEGAERTQLMRRVGVVLADQLRRDDEAVRFLESAVAGADPDDEALKILERVHMAHGDWARAVETQLRRAKSGTVADRVDALGRAARVRLDHLRDRDGAAEVYAEMLALAPDAAEALRFRGEFLWDAGDFAAAAEVYGKLEVAEMERDTDDFDIQVEVATFLFRYGDALRRAGRIPEAIARYERALSLNPNHLPSLEAVAPIYMDVKEWQKADKAWKLILQLLAGAGNPEQLSRVHANLGRVEFKLGQPDKARKRFAKALELRPNDIAALRGLGEVLYAAGDWHNLLNIFNNIIYHTQDPADVVDAYLQKGFVLDARLDLPDKAAQHYTKSLAFNPGQPLILLRLAELALRRQDWPEAASLAERGLPLAGEQPAVRCSLTLVRAVAYEACADHAAAAIGYGEAIEGDGWLAENLAGMQIDDFDAVHEVLRARLQSSPRV